MRGNSAGTADGVPERVAGLLRMRRRYSSSEDVTGRTITSTASQTTFDTGYSATMQKPRTTGIAHCSVSHGMFGPENAIIAKSTTANSVVPIMKLKNIA